MKIYQITYDLRQQRNYQPLYQRIEAISSWCHALESTWIVASEQTATQIRDHLLLLIEADDGLLVTRLSGEAAWYEINNEATRWLKQNMGAAT